MIDNTPRRRTFRALLSRSVWLIQLALATACASLCYACRLWQPSLSAHLIVPLLLTVYSITHHQRNVAVAAASLTHVAIIYRFGAALPRTVPTMVGRLLLGSLAAHIHQWRVLSYPRRMRRVATLSELLWTGCVWALFDLSLPVTLPELTLAYCPPVRDVSNLWYTEIGRQRMS